MENGRVRHTRQYLFDNLEWFPESEFEKKGLRAALDRKRLPLEPGAKGFYYDCYRCADCRKVFCEFST